MHSLSRGFRTAVSPERRSLRQWRGAYRTGTHPSSKVFEPRYLEMFSDICRDTPPGSQQTFVHILCGRAAPLAAMDDSLGGVLRVGVLCTVKHVDETPDGRMMIQYEGIRRVSLVSIMQTLPYMIAAVEWFDDEPLVKPETQACVANLEKDLWKALLEIEELTRALNGGRDVSAVLPPSVAKYAPNLDANMTSVDYLIQDGDVAGRSISQWLRSSPDGSSTKSKSRSGFTADDPYKAVRDSLNPRRTEIFSFSAACIVDMGIPERLALLRSLETDGRLQWVRSAIEPYLAELRAKAALQRTLKGRKE
mmetsp:Transcript_5609/g.15699  ORF Transcript_5609/g.15699 Transcript_5609/m.15699 type:complete len:307 (-) Transcript_5609:447-1367(-)